MTTLTVTMQHKAELTVQLTAQSAMEAPDSETLQMQLLHIMKGFTEALAARWQVAADKLMVTVERTDDWERRVTNFKFVAFSPESQEDLPEPQGTTLTLLGLRASVAMATGKDLLR